MIKFTCGILVTCEETEQFTALELKKYLLAKCISNAELFPKFKLIEDISPESCYNFIILFNDYLHVDVASPFVDYLTTDIIECSFMYPGMLSILY